MAHLQIETTSSLRRQGGILLVPSLVSFGFDLQGKRS